jgi:hypothetical protein
MVAIKPFPLQFEDSDSDKWRHRLKLSDFDKTILSAMRGSSATIGSLDLEH